MIFGKDINEIVQKAVECHFDIADGVCQYDYSNDKIVGATFTTGTVENPANKVIELLRLSQGEDGELDCKCHENGDCPFFKKGKFDEEMVDEYGDNHITCCINGVLQDWDLEDEIKENVEPVVRDILTNYLGETVSKLNEIRIAISDIVTPYNYMNVRNDNWETNVLDTYVDNAIENGFSIDGDPEAWLDAEIQHLAGVQYKDDPFWQKIGHLIENCKFHEVLELLQ